MLIASDMGTGREREPGGVEAETVAALSAASLGLGQRFAATVQQGHLRETVIQADGGSVVVYAAGRGGLLTVLTRPHANLARLHHEARQVAARLGRIVDGRGITQPPTPAPAANAPDRHRLARRTPMATISR
ncbi:roadblock/LC7 domain-containing protein [Phytohabitans maris]|nr:roadblock/LC7 domain-containing protein [Phytohabitans sp. ZYX-F-186]